MRYTLAAEEILFPNALFAWYGESARAIPVVRGNGIDQRGVDVALNVLNSGGWIHVFSEGKVNQTDQLISPFRWGVGKLVAEAQVQPIVLPIFVNGLQYTFPETARTRIPRFGYDFDFAVGDPVPDIGELRSELPTQRHTSLIDCGRAVWRARPTVLEARQVYSRITARIEQSVVELKNRIVNQSQ
jgi:monolysocardiolipin acyltransferase